MFLQFFHSYHLELIIRRYQGVQHIETFKRRLKPCPHLRL